MAFKRCTALLIPPGQTDDLQVGTCLQLNSGGDMLAVGGAEGLYFYSLSDDATSRLDDTWVFRQHLALWPAPTLWAPSSVALTDMMDRGVVGTTMEPDVVPGTDERGKVYPIEITLTLASGDPITGKWTWDTDTWLAAQPAAVDPPYHMHFGAAAGMGYDGACMVVGCSSYVVDVTADNPYQGAVLTFAYDELTGTYQQDSLALLMPDRADVDAAYGDYHAGMVSFGAGVGLSGDARVMVVSSYWMELPL
jgi:hypothetical protein